ncbi:two-component system response regulator [Pseudoxanthomonas sp. 10H]|uniref:two-component system response regulator n=1 Tax=Pseudoxanthomonas sp. 10H TaxID=3242729 RepID=UPI00355789EA
MSGNARQGGDAMWAFEPERSGDHDPPSVVPFTVLSVDDDAAFQQSLRLALHDFRFQGAPLRLLTATSAAEAEQLLATTPGISAILLDVVMETDDAGLRLVRAVREELGDHEVRIILVTGQPGVAPMPQALDRLDISEYWLKTDLHRERLQGVLTGNLRTWREINALGRAKRGLQQIVHAGRQLAGLRDLGDFSRRMLLELAELLQVPPEGLVCVRAERRDAPATEARVVGAAGRFAGLVMRRLDEVDEPGVRDLLLRALGSGTPVETPASQVLFFEGDATSPAAAVYLATGRQVDAEERELLRVFATHANAGMVNVDLAARLDEVAYHDSLLGIPNGNALQRELQRHLDGPGPSGQAMLVVDLGQYAHGSLALGPEQGDLLLRRMAQRLRQLYPSPCMVARLHEGTFAVLGPAPLLATDPVVALESVDHDHALPFLGVDAARIGLDGYHGSAREATAAGLLMLRGLRAGGGHGVVDYSPEGERDNRRRFLESRALHRAVAEGAIRIELQAQVSLEDGHVVGAEALARWTGEDGTEVPPGRFIPIAEATGLIVPLGTQVIEQACQALRAASAAGFGDLPIAVNVSPLQLRRGEFVEELVAIVERHGLSPRRLEVEITEGAVMTDYQAGREVLARLRRIGFPVAVDDFGTGYSSLRYVHSLPVSRLKLDRCFTAEIGGGGSERSVADMIIALGRRLGVDVLAEGVETPMQAEWLRAHGCHCAQGWLFARPEPLEAFLQRLRARAARG